MPVPANPPPDPSLPGRDAPRFSPMPRSAPSDDQVRREFEAFLDRAGQDTAQLSPAARATLFREYVEWRNRNPGAPGGPRRP